jgi:hypothetical protein
MRSLSLDRVGPRETVLECFAWLVARACRSAAGSRLLYRAVARCWMPLDLAAYGGSRLFLLT